MSAATASIAGASQLAHPPQPNFRGAAFTRGSSLTIGPMTGHGFTRCRDFWSGTGFPTVPVSGNLPSAAGQSSALAAGLERAQQVLANLPEDVEGRLDAIIGLFAYVPISSEEFATRKQNEIDREEASFSR